MSELLPRQSQSYLGPITDTSRWREFRHRPDDIFICTPPKCGTTWTQAICAMLVFGKVDHGEMPGMISPWIDAQFAPIEDYRRIRRWTAFRIFRRVSIWSCSAIHATCTSRCSITATT